MNATLSIVCDGTRLTANRLQGYVVVDVDGRETLEQAGESWRRRTAAGLEQFQPPAAIADGLRYLAASFRSIG